MNRVPTELAIRESQVYFRISKAQGYYCGHYRHVVPYGGWLVGGGALPVPLSGQPSHFYQAEVTVESGQSLHEFCKQEFFRMAGRRSLPATNF
jgi:hypothetical protein